MTTAELLAPPASGNCDLADLAERARTGDRAAWHEIVLRFDNSLWRIARAHGLDGPTCSDVVQQTWLAAFSQLGTLRCAEALGGWLYAIVRRESRRARTRRHRETLELSEIRAYLDDEESDGTLRADQRAPEHEVLRSAQRALLRLAWHQLPRRDQELLTLLMEEPRQPYAEISRRTGLAIGSIGPTRARCLARLRHELEALGVDHWWTAA